MPAVRSTGPKPMMLEQGGGISEIRRARGGGWGKGWDVPVDAGEALGEEGVADVHLGRRRSGAEGDARLVFKSDEEAGSIGHLPTSGIGQHHLGRVDGDGGSGTD